MPCSRVHTARPTASASCSSLSRISTAHSSARWPARRQARRLDPRGARRRRGRRRGDGARRPRREWLRAKARRAPPRCSPSPGRLRRGARVRHRRAARRAAIVERRPVPRVHAVLQALALATLARDGRYAAPRPGAARDRARRDPRSLEAHEGSARRGRRPRRRDGRHHPPARCGRVPVSRPMRKITTTSPETGRRASRRTCTLAVSPRSRSRPRVRGRPGAEAFVRQLCWRDFYAQLLAARPETAHEDVRAAPEARGKSTTSVWKRGVRDERAIPSLTPGCASSYAKAGCTTALAWSSHRSSRRT